MTDVAGAVASAVRFLAEIFMTREVAQIAAVGRTRKCAGVDLSAARKASACARRRRRMVERAELVA